MEASLRRPNGADAAARVDQWLLSAATDPAATIGLGSLGVSVPPTEIDDGVEFPQPASRGG